jgi:hypothetical protein
MLMALAKQQAKRCWVDGFLRVVLDGRITHQRGEEIDVLAPAVGGRSRGLL